METASVPVRRTLAPARLSWAVVLTCFLGWTLALGFLPTCMQLAAVLKPWISGLPRGQSAVGMALFPIVAGLFSLSLPRSDTGPQQPQSRRALVEMSLLPLAIAFAFGILLERSRLPTPAAKHLSDLCWWVVLAPLGEEFLFRGWCYEALSRVFPAWFSLTNPLPTALWLSSLAFSLWHLQNLGTLSVGFVTLQVGYTFCAGLWLGYLRWHSGGLVFPALFHVLMNAMAILPQLR